jgi:hypothetical protein
MKIRLVAWILWLLICGIAIFTSRCNAATEDEFVTGVLSVPYKWHLSDKSLTQGSTIGGYLGYQTKTFQNLTVTPILGGGLAMVSQAQPGGSGAALSTGVSLASGLIGTVGSGSTGVQLGLVLGIDWLGNGSHYRYSGRPWLAFEIGWNWGKSNP